MLPRCTPGNGCRLLPCSGAVVSRAWDSVHPVESLREEVIRQPTPFIGVVTTRHRESESREVWPAIPHSIRPGRVNGPLNSAVG